MYTYILKDGKKYKIGKSKNVNARFSGLKTGNTNIELIKTIEGNFEAKLHKHFSHLRISGEWFKLTKYDIEDIDDLILVFKSQKDSYVRVTPKQEKIAPPKIPDDGSILKLRDGVSKIFFYTNPNYLGEDSFVFGEHFPYKSLLSNMYHAKGTNCDPRHTIHVFFYPNQMERIKCAFPYNQLIFDKGSVSIKNKFMDLNIRVLYTKVTSDKVTQIAILHRHTSYLFRDETEIEENVINYDNSVGPTLF